MRSWAWGSGPRAGLRRLVLAAAIVGLLPSAAWSVSPEELPPDSPLLSILLRSQAEVELERLGRGLLARCQESGWEGPSCESIARPYLDNLVKTEPCSATAMLAVLEGVAPGAGASLSPDSVKEWRDRLLTFLPYLPPMDWPRVLLRVPPYLWDPRRAVSLSDMPEAVQVAQQPRGWLVRAPDLRTAPATMGRCGR